MIWRAEKEIIRNHGKLIVSVANAIDSEQLAHSYFVNLRVMMEFSPNFSQNVHNFFPSLKKANGLLSPTDLKIIALTNSESKLISNFSRQLEMAGYLFDKYDPENGTITLNEYANVCDGVGEDGNPDFNVTASGPVIIYCTNLHETFADIIDPRAIQDIEKLMQIGSEIKSLTNDASDFIKKARKATARRYLDLVELYNKINIIQSKYRAILDFIIEKKSLHEIPEFSEFIKIYNNLGHTILRLSDENCLIEVPLIREQIYLKKHNCHEWSRVLEHSLVYVFVEFFRSSLACEWIKKCDECKQYYLSLHKRATKYCSNKCRLDFHNRKRIQSGEHREYKRKKRREGAKESYYG